MHFLFLFVKLFSNREVKKQVPSTSNKKEPKRNFLRLLGVASTVGINLVISTFIGFAIGYFVLDRFLNTFPWFTIIFLILGIAAGFKYLFKIASRISNNKEEE